MVLELQEVEELELRKWCTQLSLDVARDRELGEGFSEGHAARLVP